MDIITSPSFYRTARPLVECARKLAARGWCPATSSNFSARLDAYPEVAAITESGGDKSLLTLDQILCVDLNGQVLPGHEDRKPSAETLIHTTLYRHFKNVQCVLHTHSLSSVMLSRKNSHPDLADSPAIGKFIFEGFEIQKALQGISTHECKVDLPVFKNTQDMKQFATDLDRYISESVRAPSPFWGLLIQGHGIYAWGESIDQAQRHLECYETLLSYEREERLLQ